ncbi:MAG: hypothetical protein ACXITV_03620 [Luteibaculaceae bacterium]
MQSENVAQKNIAYKPSEALKSVENGGEVLPYKTGAFSIKATKRVMQNPLSQNGNFNNSELRDNLDLPKQSFSENDLKAAFFSFCEQLKNQDKAGLHATLINAPLEVNESALTITLANSIQEKQLLSIRQELVEHLRLKLNNYTITVIGAISKEVAPPGFYTAEDKYKMLAEINPELDELRKRLGLDFD